MIKGGYKIIDFKDTPFITGGVTMMIEGIYDTIEASYRKPLLLSGLTIDGIEREDVFATPTLSGSNYVFTVYGKAITITDTDAVSVANSGGTFIVNAEFAATNTQVATDEATYEFLSNLNYDNIPERVRVKYSGVEYLSTVVQFDGSKITIIVNNSFCKLAVDNSSGSPKIELEA